MVSGACATADTWLVDETSLDALRAELDLLEAAEARISAERSRLHQQIDFGYSAPESLSAREREVSDERQALHRRIDSLRKLLGLEPASERAPDRAAVRELEPEGEPERPQHMSPPGF